MKISKINWGLVATSAFALAFGVKTIVFPYGEDTVFVAVAACFALALVTGALAFVDWHGKG